MRKGYLKTREGELLTEVRIARKFFERFCGLMFKKQISDSDVIVFPRCNSIHTFFMRDCIDVIFVGQSGAVIRIVEGLKPWRLLWPQAKAQHCIEMSKQRAKALGIFEGKHLICEGVFE